MTTPHATLDFLSTREFPQLIALDIDGTILHEDGTLPEAARAEVHRLRDAGHEVMLATGRSVAMTLPVLDRLDITPAYVNNAADAVAALQSGSVQAVTLWDPFLAAAESQPGLKNLRDGSGLSNNRTFYLSTASFADKHRALLKTFFAELGKVSQWANAKPEEVAALLAPQLGINANVLQAASERRNYNAVAITPEIVAEQQKLADTFQGLGLIPHKLHVADAVYPASVLP